MSDFSQGPGWWQASDGKWYPPEQAPGGAPAAGAPGAGVPPAYGAPVGAPGGAVLGGAPLASWGDRVLAWLIDVAVIIVVIIVFNILGIVPGIGVLFRLLGDLIAFAYWFYIAFMNGQVGASPGKRVTGLKVVSEADGSLIGGGMGIVRAIAHIVDSIICYIGWFFPIWDDKRQTIADKIMHTVVLKDQPKMALGPDIFKP